MSSLREIDWQKPYGTIEKFWIVLWVIVCAILGLTRHHLPQSHETFWSSVAILAVILAIPQITYRFSRMTYSVGRIVISFISAMHTYERSNILIDAFRTESYEATMLQIDKYLFGGNPSEWAQALHHPVLTEYLQIVYIGYFPLLLWVGLALLARRDYRTFNEYVLAMNFSLIFLHVCYFFVPVRSPFVIVDMQPYAEMISYEIPLAGLGLTETLRQSLLEVTTMRYDCFPSGHTMLSLIAMAYAPRVNRVFGVIVGVLGVSIIFATLYLRYHYAIDLFAGAASAAIWLWFAHDLNNRVWSREPQPTGEFLGTPAGSRQR